jgi:quercetin dioxygenase-like cupin family protein
MLPCRINFEQIPWESPMPGVRFKTHIQDNKRIRLVEYNREFIEPDWCRKGHIGYVLEGRFSIDFSGQTTEYAPGDGIFIPPGEEHKHKAIIHDELVKVVLVEDI